MDPPTPFIRLHVAENIDSSVDLNYLIIGECTTYNDVSTQIEQVVVHCSGDFGFARLCGDECCALTKGGNSNQCAIVGL